MPRGLQSVRGGKRTLDKAFSEYIRLKDASPAGYVQCVTCGGIHHWKEMDAGHCINRKFEITRFDERNVHPQCRYCNRFCEGNVTEYTLYLEGQYGTEAVEEMAKISHIIGFRWTIDDLQMILDEVRRRLKIIKAGKRERWAPITLVNMGIPYE